MRGYAPHFQSKSKSKDKGDVSSCAGSVGFAEINTFGFAQRPFGLSAESSLSEVEGS